MSAWGAWLGQWGNTPYAGQPIGPGPHPSMVAGAGQLTTAPGDLITARFGWAALDGTVRNFRTAPSDRLGLIYPVVSVWSRSYYKNGVQYARAGFPITLATRGAFYLPFAGGAWPGQRVYAANIDGSAICGVASNAELTPWTVESASQPGQLSIISTWSDYV